MVAITGNSMQDSGTLSLADVGFSMGIQGTDMAREKSSIVLLRDDFGSILQAMMWGREIHDSIRKLLTF